MITRKEYQARRYAVAKCLPSDCIALIPAASEILRNGDAHYRFRQDSDFSYLTGFNEPDALLIITSGNKSENVLFNRQRDPLAEQWTGKRLGQEGVPEILGIETAYAIEEIEERLPEFLADKKAIYYPIDRFPEWSKRIQQAWQVVKGKTRRGVAAPEAFCDLTPIVSELRLHKSSAEIDLMQKAAKISVAAHQRAMQACKSLNYEYQMEAELLYEFARQGCRSVAYDPIVASGANTCILHYTENDKALSADELVLIDAAGEFENYAADITRTFPVSGRFSSEQQAIYELVLQAQKAGIACIRPGVFWDEIQKTIVQILTTGLADLGLLKGNVADLIQQEAYKPMYMHNSGHWLGLDVHDCGQYKIKGKWRTFEPGMVLTVEPGLYISEGLKGVNPRWWGIGVRIEDDILVTDDGCKNLSGELAKELNDIEALIRG